MQAFAVTGVRSGSIDSLMHRLDEEFAPAVNQAPDSSRTSRSTRATVETVRLFHDKAAAEASKLAADYVRANLAECELTRTAVRCA